jgi:hypothetical protein
MSATEIQIDATTVLRLDESKRWGHWFAHNLETGDSYDTGTSVTTDARRVVFERRQRKTAPARYEIASGPERARAGHQRRRAADFQ